ncbi:uncharacterized protein LOC132061173 [Lycium ferocissimum]|uniref:uncharacterized protein LOC132061173 n=1 Tax=Lycium ferocissimum TaxID=112874 RepID=UPI0028164764|nr:uncharacterized protein LOC132061173 [Lycium ferocissimum]
MKKNFGDKKDHTWFSEGDRNTRFFHNLVNGRRIRLQVNRIQISDGEWIEDKEQLAAKAINFFQQQFSQEDEALDFGMLKRIPQMVSSESNDLLCALPSPEEVKNVIFELKGESACGPDGLSGTFFHFMLGHCRNGCFVKGRSIIENVLLTQEIVTDIRKRGKPANVVIKLDMAKAYDRVSWLYLTKVLRRMGFAEILRIRYGVQITDDTIIFASADKLSLELTMSVLRDYEKMSEISTPLCQEVERMLGFTRGMFPFKYLGCPIFYSRKRKVYYNDLIKRVKDRLQNWKGRLLSFGGKVVLINSVLQSMPMYLLSAMAPTKYTLNELHKIFARFYWSNNEEGKSRHWSAWLKVCVPKQEGGLGFRSLFDVSKALFTKLWWRFRTSGTLWSTFMWNKYCEKHIPTRVQWKGGSQLWKKMLESRDAIEGEIWWEPRNGSANF